MSASRSTDVAVLATPDQLAVKPLAIKVFASPAVTAQIAESKQSFLASPVAITDEAQASVDRALKEFALAVPREV
jgi:hypothetical protein